jgi:hypothetical protein
MVNCTNHVRDFVLTGSLLDMIRAKTSCANRVQNSPSLLDVIAGRFEDPGPAREIGRSATKS